MRTSTIIDFASIECKYNLVTIFKEDLLFNSLIEELVSKKEYFQSLPKDEAIDQISWWLVRSNVSPSISGIKSMDDVKKFSEFLLNSIPVLRLYVDVSNSSDMVFD